MVSSVVSNDTGVLVLPLRHFTKKEKFSTEIFMGSPIGDHNIIDIKVEKYKQSIPDNCIGRHAISGYDTCTVTCYYGVDDKYVFKLVILFLA